MATIHYFLLFICIGAHFICPMNDASGASFFFFFKSANVNAQNVKTLNPNATKTTMT